MLCKHWTLAQDQNQKSQQTCGRCDETPQRCDGRGIARKCEAAGGVRIEFSDYILGLWKKIGYSPSNGELANVSSEENDPEVEQNGGSFTPVKVPSGPVEKYTGVRINQFPKEWWESDDVAELLAGVPFEAGAVAAGSIFSGVNMV